MALNISRGVVFKAQKICVYGPEGIGKSTFAAQFPEPVFIDTEGSTNHMNVARLPRPSSWTMLLDMIREIKNDPSCCKTLIIDTVDWAEQLCVNHICAVHNKKGVEDFGYGKGYVYVKEEIGRLLNLLQDVIDVGINVVLTAHASIRKFELPDECGSFDRYELKLGNKTGGQTSALVKEWVDMVLFANYKQHVVEIDKKKKAQGGNRVMYTVHHPCWDAKNRHDLKPELPFEYAQIAYCIPNHSDEVKQPEVKQEQIQLPPVAPPVVEQLKEIKPIEQPKAEPPKQSTSEPVKPKADNLQGLPKSLVDLMTANNVTAEEIQSAVSLRGYYPKDTPIKNYDPSFIDGVLVGAWPDVFKMIQLERNIPF